MQGSNLFRATGKNRRDRPLLARVAEKGFLSTKKVGGGGRYHAACGVLEGSLEWGRANNAY